MRLPHLLPYVGCAIKQSCRVRGRFRKQLSDFLRQQRGAQTYAEFARRVGLWSSTLQRLEVGEQNVTIDTLELLVGRLKCSVGDIFQQ